MAETKTDKIEREYIIPLREKCRSVPRYKKANKAVKSIKEFLVRHMKIRDRDLKKVRLDMTVNETVWARGIRSPPHKIAIKAVKENGIVVVSIPVLSKKIAARKRIVEKRNAGTASKAVAPEVKNKVSEDANKDGIKDKVEVKEKTKANEEASEKAADTKKKEAKKTTDATTKKTTTKGSNVIAK